MDEEKKVHPMEAMLRALDEAATTPNAREAFGALIQSMARHVVDSMPDGPEKERKRVFILADELNDLLRDRVMKASVVNSMADVSDEQITAISRAIKGCAAIITANTPATKNGALYFTDEEEG